MIETGDKSERDTRRRGNAVRLLVIGCGNPLAGDDSAGVEILRRLRAREDCECELRAMPEAGVELLESLEEAEVILFLDAVSSGAPPGTLHLVPLPWAGIEPRALGALSSHGWGLAETLALAQALGRRAPFRTETGRAPRLVLLGVEIARVSIGAERSAAVEEAIEVVVKNFSRLLSLVNREESAGWRCPRRFSPAGYEAGLPGEISFPGGLPCV